MQWVAAKFAIHLAVDDQKQSRLNTYHELKEQLGVLHLKSNVKIILIRFIDAKGVVYRVFVPLGQTVNHAFYLAVLKHLRDTAKQKRTDQWHSSELWLYHNKTPSHTTLSINWYWLKMAWPRLSTLSIHSISIPGTSFAILNEKCP